ncbi:uncharacterized protein METZ01_LOCUS85231, partial [marine metagenome]
VKISRKKSKMVWLFFVWIIIQTGVVFPAISGDIIITEFFFNKSAGNLPEYIELFNNTDSTIDLNGWKVQIDDKQVVIDCCSEVTDSLTSYSDETACTDAGNVWDPFCEGNSFSINSNDYVLILSKNGLLLSKDGEDETTYCSSINYGFPFNICDMPIDNLFWSIGTFFDLSNISGTIKIWDNANTINVIDSV